MERSAATLRIGAWLVDPASGEILREGETARLEVRALRLLLYLAERAGEVVSIDELLDHVWSGVTVSSDSVYQAVTSLRRQLGDDPKQPAYIATVPRLGYRMIAAVSTIRPAGPEPTLVAAAIAASPASDPPPAPSPPSALAAPAPHSRSASRLAFIGAAALCLALIIVFLLNRPGNHKDSASAAIVPQPLKSVAVLPFLDLTPGMKEEEFADGMTEELIDKLSKVQGLSVPAPTASFYYKEKRIPVAEIARALGVTYVLDGSVRKSQGRVRIAARLVRAENGYVMWTETYDRPFDDRLMIQDDIASDVTKALAASIEGQSPRR